MTTLNDIIDAHVSEVFLNTEHFAECVVVSAGGKSRKRTLLISEISEQDGIRRAEVHSDSDQEFTHGSLFTRDGITWRMFFEDTTHHSMTRWVCHEQLPELVVVVDRSFSKSARGVDVFTQADRAERLRAKVHRIEGEITEGARRRRMQSEFRIYFESDLRPTTDQLIVDELGNSYQVESYVAPEGGDQLPFVIAVVADG